MITNEQREEFARRAVVMAEEVRSRGSVSGGTLIERLRNYPVCTDGDVEDAADELERQAKEIEALKQSFEFGHDNHKGYKHASLWLTRIKGAVKAEREACAKAAGPEDSYRDEWFNAKADSVKRILARSNT